MQQFIINRKQFPPQAQHRAKDWGPATTRRHKWVTGCSAHTHTCTRKTTNPVSNSQSFLLFLLCLPPFFNRFTAIVRSAHTQPNLHTNVSSLHRPCLGDRQIDCNPPAFALRSFLTYLCETRHPRQLLLKVAEQNNDLFMVNMIHASHPS